MTKRQRPKKAEKAPAAEEQAEKALLNYEPPPIEPAEGLGVQFAYSIAGGDDEPTRAIYITVPNEPGATWEKHKTRAFRYYDALHRAEEWVEREGIVEERVAADEANNWHVARTINKYVAGIIQHNYLRVYLARALSDAEETAFLQEIADGLKAKDEGELVDRLFSASEKTADFMAEEWAALKSGSGSLPETAREYFGSHAANLAAAAILRAEDERQENPASDWSESFYRHLDALTEERTGDLALEHGNRVARVTLEEHNPVAVSLRTLRAALGFDVLQSVVEGKSSKPDALRVPTSQIARHMIGHVTSPEPVTMQYLERFLPGNHRRHERLRVTSSTNPLIMLDNPPTEVLEQMHKSILRIKSEGAALLKTHLDLQNQAYAAGGELPIFHYNLSDALERQGYARREESRGFQHSTMQRLRERVVALMHQEIDVLRIPTENDARGQAQRIVAKAPYWEKKLTWHLESGDEVSAATVLLTDPNTPTIKGFTLQAGLWWKVAQMHDYYLDIPASILELPTSGNGNEAERLTLQLAPILAIWERAGQQQHAGNDVYYKAGVLLDAAGYITRDDFMSTSATRASRMRDYLCSTTGTGAIPILNRLGAFTLDVADDADYFATRRGWRERFWDARIRLSVRDLALPKAKKKKSLKRK